MSTYAMEGSLRSLKGQYRRYVQETNSLELKKSIPTQADAPVHGSYAALLFDPRWREKRKIILVRDSNKCVICNSNNDLQVHHRQYHFYTNTDQFKPPWDYDAPLLITLCEICHRRGHNKFKVPTIKI